MDGRAGLGVIFTVRLCSPPPRGWASSRPLRGRRGLLVGHPLALAVKVSLPRPVVQGSLGDTDCYAGRQYAPLMDMEAPLA
ncbi:hypothetical protein SNE510_75200 [Streptomyces sp. NE5-10]|nr:hypothetical protein SNE510_75200 [Streptomyces sp. NE5-10]